MYKLLSSVSTTENRQDKEAHELYVNKSLIRNYLLTSQYYLRLVDP